MFDNEDSPKSYNDVADSSSGGPRSFLAEGTIDGKFDCGYLISMKLGSQVLRGVLYHPQTPATSSLDTADHSLAIVPNAKRAYDTMIDLEESYNDTMTEDEILAKALGERCGYQKGLGYGVEVPRRNATWTTSQEDSTIHEKLSETERSLESANGSIQTLTMELEEEKSKRKEYEEKLQEFQDQMMKMQQMMEMMQTQCNDNLCVQRSILKHVGAF